MAGTRIFSNMFDSIVAVGMRFRGNHIFRNTNSYTLEREPTNPYDPDAIKIMHGSTHVAYVSRDSQYKANIRKVYKLRTGFVPGSAAAYLYAAHDVSNKENRDPAKPEMTYEEAVTAIQAGVRATNSKKKVRTKTSVEARLARLKRMLE